MSSVVAAQMLPALLLRLGAWAVVVLVLCSEISADPEERRDLGQEPAHQQRVQEMLRAVVAERATAFNPHRGTVDPRACEKATSVYDNFWGPFAS